MDIKQLAQYLKQKFLRQEVTGLELVVTLMAMAKDGKIDIEGIKYILYEVFENNSEGIIRSLTKANEVLDENLIDSIISDVKKALP